MKRRPAPGIIRLPEPSAIAVDPVSGVAVRPPTAIDRQDTRLPAPADTIQGYPGSIGRKAIVKVSDLGRRAGNINRRGLRDGRRWRCGLNGRRGPNGVPIFNGWA